MTAMLTVHLDERAIEVAPGTTLAALLEAQVPHHQAVASALNGSFVPRAARAATALREGDRVLVFHAIVGG